MKKINLILLVLFFVMIPIVLSANVQTNINLEVGYEIQFPPFDIIKQNTDFNFNVHVFNKSDSLKVDNSTTDCRFHLYNSSGVEILDEEMVMQSNLFDYELIVGGGNFSYVGDYAFIVQCNSSNYGGFVSVPIEVTETGLIPENNLMAVVIAIIGLIIFFVGFAYINKDSLGFKIIGYGLAMAETLNLSFLIYLKESGYQLTTILEINFWLVLIILFMITMISIIIIIMRALDPSDPMDSSDNKKWQER